MDISGFKAIIQKLNVFKGYSSLLVPAVLVLVAVLVFIPAKLMSSKLSKKMMVESISKRGNRVKALTKSAVAGKQWQQERDYQQDYENDANKIALLASQSTQRQLLSYKIFPEPKDTSTLIFEEFGQQFRAAIDRLITRVNARDCPTDAELERSLYSSSGSASRSGWGMGRGKSYRNVSEVDAAITDVICREKAECTSVYANPADLSGYEFWKEYKYDVGMTESVEDCWYYQLAYWIIEDVFDTIGTLNSGSSSVFTSPVKRLLGIGFTASSERSRKKAARSEDQDKPGYVLSPEDGLCKSFTARLSNDDIDVVHFNVRVVVSTKAVLPFMQQLCSAKQHIIRGSDTKYAKYNQITILESQIRSIDREDETHRLYRYGEDAVVELDLTCEYIFNKNGYDEIKPESVKELLNEAKERKEGTRRR